MVSRDRQRTPEEIDKLFNQAWKDSMAIATSIEPNTACGHCDKNDTCNQKKHAAPYSCFKMTAKAAKPLKDSQKELIRDDIRHDNNQTNS